MEITSHLIDQKDVSYTVLDTIADGKHFFVSLGIGTVTAQQDDAMLTPVGYNALMRLTEISESSEGTVALIEVMNRNHVGRKIKRAFKQFTPGDAIFFVCKDDLVYDAVFRVFNLQKRDVNHQTNH